jgi:hypothetical protein
MVNGNSNEPPLSMAGVQGFPRRAADAVAPSHYAEIVMQPDRRKLAQSFVIPARTGKGIRSPCRADRSRNLRGRSAGRGYDRV